MGVFELVILIILISTVGKIGLVMADHIGEAMKESAAAKRARREAAIPSGDAVDMELMEEVEKRLARIEDRLDFLEELRAPPHRPSLEPPREPRRPGSADRP